MYVRVIVTMWGRRAVAKAPPFLFLHGGGSWWPRHSRSLLLYHHGRARAHHGSMLNKAWETCDTKSNSHTCITFILARN